MPVDWSVLWFSLRYAGMATVLALLAALPLVWLLDSRPLAGHGLWDALVNLPLILPPAVTVYYLLSTLQRWPLQFTWHVAVVLSAIYTLPLLVRLAWPGFAGVDDSYKNAARGLGAGEWRVFWRITMPLAWRSFGAALVVAFVRAFADFFAAAVLAGGAPSGALASGVILAVVGIAALYLGNRIARRQVPA